MTQLPKAIRDALSKVDLDERGYDRNVSLDDIERRKPPLTREQYAYRRARKELIPAAQEHAKAWAKRSEQAVIGCWRGRAVEQVAKMEALAFSNQMQRLAFAAQVGTYDPEACAHYVSEQALLDHQTKMPKLAEDKRANRRPERERVAFEVAA